MKRTILVAIASIGMVGSSAIASPEPHRVSRIRAVIESIDKGDPKSGTKPTVKVREVGRRNDLTSRYLVSFADPNAIEARTPSRGHRKIKFEDLRVGMELVFSGTALGWWITPKQVTVFLP